MDRAQCQYGFHGDHGVLTLLRRALSEEGVDLTAEDIDADPADVRTLMDDESRVVQTLRKLLSHFGILGVVEVDWEEHIDEYTEYRVGDAWREHARTEWGRVCDEGWEAFVEENFVEKNYEGCLEEDWIEHADSEWGDKPRNREYGEWARAAYPAWAEAKREAWANQREAWEEQQWPSWEREQRWAWESEAYSDWLDKHGPEWQRRERARLEACPWVRIVDAGEQRHTDTTDGSWYWALPPLTPYEAGRVA